jgi:Bacterial Ig-like domain (group 2)
MAVLGGQWIVVGGAPLQFTALVYTRIATTELPAEYVEDSEHVAWSSDPSGIVSIDRQGRVTALSSGSTLVKATIGDHSATSQIRAVPDYTGQWSGTYIVTNCTGALDPRTCGRMMLGESFTRIPYPFSLTLSQDRDQVTGTLNETSPTFNRVTPVNGYLRLTGSLVLEAVVPQPDLEAFRITNWVCTETSSRTQLSGAFTRIAPTRFSTGGNVYTLRTEHEFSGVTRQP